MTPEYLLKLSLQNDTKIPDTTLIAKLHGTRIAHILSMQDSMALENLIYSQCKMTLLYLIYSK